MLTLLHNKSRSQNDCGKHCLAEKVVSGVCEEECAQVMKEFFQRRRRENKQRKQNLQD